jgi:hypothetical protein
MRLNGRSYIFHTGCLRELPHLVCFSKREYKSKRKVEMLVMMTTEFAYREQSTQCTDPILQNSRGIHLIVHNETTL